ncbi:MAG: hypothetical protein A3G52_02280 [Candidatus Taylorbacteria bacterium RIFCSPLOWO2_12_FULL_43_20]|uniref:Methyltransferase type 11 domain-containing protein n=1 Tax=Candidatus Taylorbacteria bacterium RIFCSPLOWO2_12_FULL_43_20 TaxID=1802332 RepID=A0A1G2P3L5_9BACT|nr:MAG: hypothetical protein A3E92_02675 [Candidatus Taylorbacteria bacterium RIFCSPHIGHO2_12_FULL_42_34]OHA42920.1 MAG: hypothetical protein A3G52_02280 [Candidatus Taylorbacteria bacterium RIFCSPLOWO2_12_FULL_43_20]
MKNLKNTREVIAHTAHFVSGKTLDFGAGSAKYRNLIVPHTSEYITFDMIKGTNIDVVGDALNPPFPNNHFDTVISTQVLEHVEKPWIMVSEIGRILKPGGVCIITAPFMAPYHADPHDFFRFTIEGLASLFVNNEFEIIEHDSYGKIFSVLSEMIHFMFFSPYRRSTKRRDLWGGRIMRRVESLAYLLDKSLKNKIIYPNGYVVARKKRT